MIDLVGTYVKVFHHSDFGIIVVGSSSVIASTGDEGMICFYFERNSHVQFCLGDRGVIRQFVAKICFRYSRAKRRDLMCVCICSMEAWFGHGMDGGQAAWETWLLFWHWLLWPVRLGMNANRLPCNLCREDYGRWPASTISSPPPPPSRQRCYRLDHRCRGRPAGRRFRRLMIWAIGEVVKDLLRSLAE